MMNQVEGQSLVDVGQVAHSVKKWVNSFVVDLNLCPFAKRELINDRVRFTVSEATSEQQLLQSLQQELAILHSDQDIETTLLIHPQVLQDFEDYNQFLGDADNMLCDMGFEGVYQIASFHPQYQFGGTQADDAENYTNRSPYPLLHIIREESLEKAIAGYPDVEQVPLRNVALMNSMGSAKLFELFENLFNSKR